MSFVRRILHSQCNTTKVYQCSRNCSLSMGYQRHSDKIMTSSSPVACLWKVKEWKFDHTTSSPRNPRSNGQAEAAVKVIKGLPYQSKILRASLHWWVYRSTPIDAHLQSPAEMLYQRTICTILPQRICPHAAADYDQLNQYATQSAEYAGPVIWQAAHGSYLVRL